MVSGSGDVTNARDRLRGVLQELLEQSDDSSLSSHDDPSQSDLFNQQMAVKKAVSIKSWVFYLLSTECYRSLFCEQNGV